MAPGSVRQALFVTAVVDEPHQRHRDPWANECPSSCQSAGHMLQRSFSVVKPINANTTAMIQKRTTMVLSSQPFCSKW